MKSNNQKKQIMTVTTARKQIFELVDAAYYQGIETTLTKNGKEIAKIVPMEEKRVDWAKRLEEMKNFKPFMTDEDVEEYKQIRKEFNTSRFPDW